MNKKEIKEEFYDLYGYKKPNEQQKKIIEHRGENLLVSADAGTGKTKVLIDRIIDIIADDKCGVNELLVATFTREAGNQMLSKLSQKIADKILDYDKVIAKLRERPETNEEIINDLVEEQLHLEQQLELLPKASIGTLHTFCEGLLKKYFYAIEIEVLDDSEPTKDSEMEKKGDLKTKKVPLSPTFKILEESDGKFFKNQILDKIFEDYNENEDQRFLKTINYFISNNSLVNFKNELVNLLSFIKSKRGYIDFIDYKSDKYSEKLETREEECNTILNNYIKKRADILKKIYDDIKDKLPEERNEVEQKIYNYITTVSENLGKITLGDDYKTNYEKFADKTKQENGKSVNLPGLNSKKSQDYTEEDKKIINEITNYNEELQLDNDISKIIKAEIVKQKEGESGESSTSDIQEMIIDILIKFDLMYKKVKLEKELLDFNDLEEYTLEILSKPEIRDMLRSKYKYVFIDEYQDINEIQEDIILNISNGTNLFMVGDVKQSIYGFRNTSPEIFIDKYEKYKSGDLGKVIDLVKNYRSQKKILDYCNEIFGNIMTKKTSDIDYRKSHKFMSGIDYVDKNGSVDIYLIEEDKEIDKKDLYLISENDTDSRNLELDFLLKLVNDILETGEIYNNDTKTDRKCIEDDICVLSRNNYAITEIARKFIESKIAFTAKYKVKLYREEEINLILSILQMIQNSDDDINLLTVLKSYIYNVTDEELIRIKRDSDGEKYYYNMVKMYKDKDDELAEKIKSFYVDIDELRTKSYIMSLQELVEFICQKFNIKAYFLQKKDSDFRVKNIDTYVSTLSEGFYTQNLTSYLNYIKGFAIDDEFDIEVNGGENSIKLQTIHSSKGLEYNIVIMYDIQREYNLRDDKIVKDKDYGLVFQEIDSDSKTKIKNIESVAVKIKKNIQKRKEEMRLFYVGLTRAKTKLIMIGNVDSEEKLCSYNREYEELKDLEVLKSKSYLSYILGILDDGIWNELKQNKSYELNSDDDSTYMLHYMTKIDIPEIKGEEDIKDSIEKINFDDVKFGSENKYYNLEGVYTRLKNTVTGLQEEDKKFEINFERLNNSGEDKIENGDEPITALEKGNSYHYVMRDSNLDINNLEKLRQMPEYKNVDEEKIKKCIEIVSKLAKGRKIYPEKMFMMYINKSLNSEIKENRVLIQGVVDLILEGEDDIIVLDYKTTRGNDEFLKEIYSKQLELYSIAVENHYKKPITQKYLYSFEENKLILLD